MGPEKLSDKEHWEAVCALHNLPRENARGTYNYRVTMDFVAAYLKGAGYRTFMEIGCAASAWLPYFAREYGYSVSGLDYSETGCRLAEENLRLLGLKYDEIVCADIFEWGPGKKYDVIFSYGVIEHFDDPGKILGICREHLRENGLLITVVPNFNGLMGFLNEAAAPDIYRMHKVLTREQLVSLHEAAGLKNVRTDYAGIFSLAVVPWARSRRALLRPDGLPGKVAARVINYANLAFSLVLKHFDRPTSKFMSPYIISVARNAPPDPRLL
jgi:2-polyprenyl-3-methyl-5-hydroxy-6-metoxy-1,4-benzoquinol methylase